MMPRSEGVYRANLEALEPPMIQLLNSHKEVETPVENDVRVVGLKNPSCAVILGFSTDKVLKNLLNNSKKKVRHVIVIEPDMGRFHATLRRHYIADYLRDDRIDFIIGVSQSRSGSLIISGCLALEALGPSLG